MPVGISSPARNLFLLGSTGEQTVTNFFKAVDLSSSTDGVFLPEAIKYRYGDDSYTIGGTASDPQSKRFGWIENRTYNPETAASTQVWDDRIESTAGQSVFLRNIIFDQVGRIIAVGHGGGTCWIRRYSSAGVLDWQASTFTGEARYLGVAHDGVAYYACGHTGPGDDDSAIAYVEKFDDQGNPIWGKAAFFENDDLLLESIAIADDGNILAVGRIDDNDGQKGFMVKLDSQTGDVLWDKTITSPKKFNQFLTLKESVGLEKIYTDGNGQFYVAGRVLSTRSGSLASRGILIKFDTEGNIIWQKETPLTATKSIEFFDVSAETDTEQVIVLGRYYDGIANDEMGILSKYTKNGTLLWRRTIKSSRESSDKFSTAVNPPALDADSSFYYLLFRDESIDALSGEPDRYTFGKVSTSGNGLGDFQYADSTGETIDYEIVNIDSNIGILQDGSVTNSVSDLRSTPYSADKIVFDDYATNIAGKKRKVSEGLQSFMYSGSPAIRPADFETREFTTDGYGVPPQKNYIGLSESLQFTSTSNTGTTNNTWSRQTTNVTMQTNNLSNPLGVGSGAERYNISATTGRRLEYGVPSGVFVAGQTYTYSWWMKAIPTDAGNLGRWAFQAYNAGSSNNSIRIADRYGNILENVSTTNTTNYKPKDTEWHRVVWTFTANNTTASPIGGYNDNNETGNLWYLWGAQLVDGPDPLPYYRNHNGSPENAAGTEHAPSIVNGAYEFDGSEILQIGPVPEIGDEFTVEMWFKSDTHSNWQNPIDCNYGSQDLLGNGLVNSGNIGPRLEINASGTFAWVFGSTLGANDPFFSLPAGSGSTGVWYHSVITYGGGGALDGNSYLNGEFVQRSSQTVAGTAGWVGEFRNVILGRGFTLATRYFDGQIGEVRIYPKALTAAQVFQNYNATKSKYINEAPVTAPRIGPGIVYGNDIVLNYDFGNRATYDTAQNEIRDSTKFTAFSTVNTVKTLNAAKAPDGSMSAVKIERGITGSSTWYLDYVAAIPANNAGTYTYSVWLRGPDGFTGGARIALLEQTGGNTEVSVNLTDQWQQYSVTKTYDGSFSTNIRVHPVIFRNQPGAIDAGKVVPEFIYMWQPQLEKASTIGRHVPTYGSAITAPTTVKNLSSSSYTGTINGATFNSAGYFDFGTTSQQNLISTTGTNCSTLLGTTDSGGSCTIECWVNLDDTSTRQTILAGYTAGDNMRWDLEVQNGNLQFHRHANGTTTATGGISLNWNHVVVTRGDGSDARIRIYLNGSEVGTSLLGGPLGSGVPLGLGMRSDGSTDFPLDGKIGEVRTYTRFLSATEVSQNYNATSTKYGV